MGFLRPRRIAFVALLATVIVGVSATAAFAEGPDIKPGDLAVSTNLLWICVAGALVMFMQGGFALVETGFTRKKNAAHTMVMNGAIFGTAFVAFFIVGYALMFGGYALPKVFGYDIPIGSGFIGSHDWVFLWKGPLLMSGKAYRPAILAYFFYMAAFMDATATIPTGAMAERWKWNNFLVWGFFCGAIYYPLFGAWTWGGGWLAKLGESASLGHGYVDFAGNMDTCIALRTIVWKNGQFDVQAGAGVVADSVPATEYEETISKAKAMLKAVEIAEKGF